MGRQLPDAEVQAEQGERVGDEEAEELEVDLNPRREASTAAV